MELAISDHQLPIADQVRVTGFLVGVWLYCGSSSVSTMGTNVILLEFLWCSVWGKVILNWHNDSAVKGALTAAPWKRAILSPWFAATVVLRPVRIGVRHIVVS